MVSANQMAVATSSATSQRLRTYDVATAAPNVTDLSRHSRGGLAAPAVK